MIAGNFGEETQNIPEYLRTIVHNLGKVRYFEIFCKLVQTFIFNFQFIEKNETD